MRADSHDSIDTRDIKTFRFLVELQLEGVLIRAFAFAFWSCVVPLLAPLSAADPDALVRAPGFSTVHTPVASNVKFHYLLRCKATILRVCVVSQNGR